MTEKEIANEIFNDLDIDSSVDKEAFKWGVIAACETIGGLTNNRIRESIIVEVKSMIGVFGCYADALIRERIKVLKKEIK